MNERRQQMADETLERVDQSRERAKEHLRTAIETEERVIADNENLKNLRPERTDVYERRIAEGEQFLQTAEQELGKLEAHDSVPGESAPED